MKANRVAKARAAVLKKPVSETTQHTPGPWAVGDLDRNGQRVVRNRDIEIVTCWHHSVGAIEKEMEANAKLIAAAPEMLAALEEAFQLFAIGHALDHFNWSASSLRAEDIRELNELPCKIAQVIQKAKGEYRG